MENSFFFCNLRSKPPTPLKNLFIILIISLLVSCSKYDAPIQVKAERVIFKKVFTTWRYDIQVFHFIYQSTDGLIQYDSPTDLGQSAVVFVQW